MEKAYQITKSGRIDGVAVDGVELEAINRFTLSPLHAGDVFAFRVAACGNDVDRDFEAFPIASLQRLAEMFPGKTVVMDHEHSARNQVARIYRAEAAPGEGIAKTGEPYARLVVYCYMVRTEKNRDMITEIQAGIKKEVSVGCAVSQVVCSVCGADNRVTLCEHRSGKEYDGAVCYRKLCEPTDAYELSFVAVPAQPDAGVIKDYGGQPPGQPEPAVTEQPPDQPKPTKSVRERLAEIFYR